jgi:hypothetical protein
MSTQAMITGYVFFFAFFAAIIALFLKGSRPTTHLFAYAIVALISPGFSILMVYFSTWFHPERNPFFGGMVALPVLIGAYCGRRAFRATGARLPVRLAGLLAVIVCVPFAFLFLLITVLNLGPSYNPN